MILHGMYIMRDYGLYFGGGSYSSVYVPPPLHVFHNPCSVYSCGIYLFFCPFIFCIPISLKI